MRQRCRKPSEPIVPSKILASGWLSNPTAFLPEGTAGVALRYGPHPTWWSSGMDSALSRRRRGFNSLSGDLGGIG